MASPFDIAKSILQTKVDAYTVEDVFNKEYTPFMVNRILSNSDRTVFFAECMDRYSCLDKKLQYDFYFKGIPKSKSFSKMWSKKETSTLNTVHIEHICERLNISMKRGTEIYKLLGPAVIEAELDNQGGTHNGNKRRTKT